MSVESAPLQGITLYSHADDFRSHWIRYVLTEKQIKYNLILVDADDEMIVIVRINCMPMLRCPGQSNDNTSGALKMTG